MKSVLLFLAGLVLYSCQPSNPVPAKPDIPAIKDSIEIVFSTWSDQFESLSVEGIMEYMADDDEVIWASDGSITMGHDDIGNKIKEELSPIEKWNYTNYGQATISVLGFDAAVHTVNFEESLTLSTGDTIVVRGVWTNVFKRIEGDWKIINSAVSYLDD